MRFGISATSLMCPKNLRTRLRPVNVCCAIVASHFVARFGRTFRSAIGIAPGLNFDSFRGPEDRFSGLSPEFVLQTFTTQNDARGDRIAPARQNHCFTDCKSPKLPISQRLAEVTPPLHLKPCFRAAVPIWDGNRGDSRGKPANPHTFSCSARSGPPRRTPFA